VESLRGKRDDPTISINVALDNGTPTAAKVLGSILKDNSGPRSTFNLMRLVAATGSELAACYFEKAKEAVRSKAYDLMNG
jgi:hypothetical protein